MVVMNEMMADNPWCNDAGKLGSPEKWLRLIIIDPAGRKQGMPLAYYRPAPSKNLPRNLQQDLEEYRRDKWQNLGQMEEEEEEMMKKKEEGVESEFVMLLAGYCGCISLIESNYAIFAVIDAAPTQTTATVPDVASVASVVTDPATGVTVVTDAADLIMYSRDTSAVAIDSSARPSSD